jgi:DNA repair protein RadC
MGALTMKYGQTASCEQMNFLGEVHTTKPKRSSIPIYRVTLVREGKIPTYEARRRSSASAYSVLQEFLADTDREHFVILMLDQKNQVIGINTVSIGSLTARVVHPREVYKPAILSNCAALILGHNHPSGDPQPSKEDRAITQRLKEAGALLGINVLDHLVIGADGRYFSFADENLL